MSSKGQIGASTVTADDNINLDLLENLKRLQVLVSKKTDLSSNDPLRGHRLSSPVTEYSAKCPLPDCSSQHDAFIIWDGRTDGGLSFWCRKCGRRGFDIFDFYYELEGLAPRDVADKLGLNDITLSYRRNRIRTNSGVSLKFLPKDAVPPSESWQDCVRGILNETKERLHTLPRVVDYLRESRGLYPNTIDEAGLGFHPVPKKLKRSFGDIGIPSGILIPNSRQGILYNVKVRDLGKYGGYSSIKGSKPTPMLLCPEHSSRAIIVESEFDGLLLYQYIHEAELPCAVVALGGRTLGYDLQTHKLLQGAEKIFILMDNDKAGEISADLLVRRYSQSHKITLPIGKDPGEAYQKGLDLEQWAIDLLS